MNKTRDPHTHSLFGSSKKEKTSINEHSEASEGIISVASDLVLQGGQNTNGNSLNHTHPGDLTYGKSSCIGKCCHVTVVLSSLLHCTSFAKHGETARRIKVSSSKKHPVRRSA